jgi:hypothetical protein
LHLAFCIRYKKVQNDNQIYMQLKTWSRRKMKMAHPHTPWETEMQTQKWKWKKKELGYFFNL